MNTNLQTNDMNIEDYEDQAVKKSKLAKGIGLAVAGAAGGAAIAAGTTYAATDGNEDTILDGPLNADELAMGAEVGEEIQPVDEAPEQPSVQYVYVEKPAPAPEPEKTPDVVWEETTEYYINGQKVASVEEGTIDGHDVMLVDADADGHADILAYDVNGNHEFEANEIMELTPKDDIHMGSPTAHTTAYRYESNQNYFEERGQEDVYAYEVEDQHQIHNNFEDEKTGEYYSQDFAENNPDYNPNADLDYGNEQYLAENYGYDNEDYGQYHAGLSEMEEEGNVAEQPDLADASDMSDESFDSMLGSEEFLG